LCKVAGGMEAGTSFLSDLVVFVQTLLQEMAGQFCGRRAVPGRSWEEEEYHEQRY